MFASFAVLYPVLNGNERTTIILLNVSCFGNNQYFEDSENSPSMMNSMAHSFGPRPRFEFVDLIVELNFTEARCSVLRAQFLLISSISWPLSPVEVDIKVAFVRIPL